MEIQKETDDALMTVRTERERQNNKWGVQEHVLPVWVAIGMEEAGELAERALEMDLREAAKEAKEVAAVMVATMESIERQLAGAAPRTDYTHVTPKDAAWLCVIQFWSGKLAKAILENNDEERGTALRGLTLAIL